MLTFPRIDPVAITLGPLQFRWYGLMYLFGFLSGWWLGRRRAAQPGSRWTGEMVDDMVTYVILGVVLGGRIGYILFYDLAYYLSNPTQIFSIWNGGMSFHGGLLGVVFAMWLLGRRNGLGFMDVSDFVAPLIPPGLFFGRIGNFINGELWGKHTTLPWGMVFPDGGPFPRHPSQLYECALEGVILFLALWVFSSRKRPTGHVSGLFALLYGVFRFTVEFVREPDVQLGYLAFGWLTMGQVLCLPLIMLGLWLLRPGGDKGTKAA
ncbi:prolipoprotein diacylglyceryl transferase [Nitratidesulfovibrio vulgaris]|uniref:Phosphatidylglycerol--prolipoprotein diacylglyceryl transferase n=1 Tax=Nitratidesulfovibrio vulgaris (strain DP4) TaxID=391774 RepID=LGT_NITV4|nr:prolipoprotein diacylglyceryl transferase [Nitratidesulfovibrio vulgaris]A1VHP3.1 RecName: Full=Phosphatidylglycerol--prolipoprotein diacylglyceryl transferase [Nitratidesulfovibrio vulgaris DP4]ABM29959.1 prolipoprotein diacylglyceryl transferase [Nitratidesulfovibrio vulgaris DP4]GEB78866.1 prolipoprotein diacylglyceryl transferase [Desulfovibrio desulfuricans]HBW14900.1 prolipoprotein diacylglyceryl transferase [Desulfovibrio sp.]